VRGCQGPGLCGVSYTLDGGAGGFTFAVKKLKWLGSLFNRTNKQTYYEGEKARASLPVGA
jgi:hypothetical protein